jgi:hypothetical protein
MNYIEIPMKRILSIIDHLDIRMLLFAIPLISLLHELEEWNILGWHRKVNSLVPDVTDLHVRIALVLVVLLHFAWIGLSLTPKSIKVTYYLVIPLLALSIQNGIQHFIWWVQFGIYAPGVIFGCFLGIPVSVYIIYRIMKQQVVVPWYLVVFSGIATLGVVQTVLRGNKIDPTVANAMIVGRGLSHFVFGQ